MLILSVHGTRKNEKRKGSKDAEKREREKHNNRMAMLDFEQLDMI